MCIEHYLAVFTKIPHEDYIYYIYIYDVVKSKRRHWLAVTLSFTPCGDRQTDFYYNEEISLALYTVYLC